MKKQDPKVYISIHNENIKNVDDRNLLSQISDAAYQAVEPLNQAENTFINTNSQKPKIKSCAAEINDHVPEHSSELEDYLNVIRLKDEGYPWVMVLAMLVSNVLVAGYIKSFGIMYNAVLEEFPDTSSTTAGLMMGLLGGCRSMFSPVAGALSIKLGCRSVITGGTLLCVFGLISSYFCTSVLQLAFTLGAMMGIGSCLIETCQVVILASFFEKKLSKANSFRICGNTAGGMVFPFLLMYLLESFGVRQSRILLGAVFLHNLICMALIRSQEVHKRIQILSAMNHVQKINENKIAKEEKKNVYLSILNTFREPLKPSSKKRPLELGYLKNGVYLLFIGTSMSISLALPFVIYFIPIYGKSFDLSIDQISYLLLVQNFLDLVFRIIIGYFSDKKLYKKAHGFIVCLAIGGFGTVVIPFCTELWQLYLAITLFTVGSAGYYSFMSVVLTEQFGKNSIATTWGFVRMVQGLFNFAYSPLLGAIIDVSQSFVPVFIVMGGGMLLASMFLLLEPIVIKLTKSKVIIS